MLSNYSINLILRTTSPSFFYFVYVYRTEWLNWSTFTDGRPIGFTALSDGNFEETKTKKNSLIFINLVSRCFRRRYGYNCTSMSLNTSWSNHKTNSIYLKVVDGCIPISPLSSVNLNKHLIEWQEMSQI